MKLTDLIMPRSESRSALAFGWNAAVDATREMVEFAESQGYRLVRAMPQHIEPMGEEA